MHPRRLAILLALCAALSVSLGACGSTSSSSGGPVATVGTAHAVIGYAAHTGLAFGVIHHFIIVPFREHELSFRHPIKLTEAAAAAIFALHELKVARSELVGHPRLAALVGPVTALAGLLGVLHGTLARGGTAGVGNLNTDLASVSSRSASLGTPITPTTSGFHL